jgi:Na+/H+-dicarboxylate symporter
MIYALFLAHLYHINLGLSQTITLVIVSFLSQHSRYRFTKCSLLSPITTLFEALALPTEMIVSVVNVTGDMTVVAVVANYTKEIPKPGEGHDDLIAKGS